jgi:hypothetical protein
VFYEILGRSLSEYAADKLRLSRHALSRDELAAAMTARAIPADATRRLIEILERCDLGRYAPGSDEPARREELLGATEALITELEGRLRG